MSPRRFCNAMRHYGAVTCGLSSKWWSEKHNLHHAFTNVVGVDEDIMVREQSRGARKRQRQKRERRRTGTEGNERKERKGLAVGLRKGNC